MHLLRRVSLLPLVIAGLTASAPALAAPVAWPRALQQPADYYAGPEARALALLVVAHQTPSGGWPKNTDFSSVKPAPGREATIDNGGTTTPLRFLARVIAAAPDSDKNLATLRSSFERGFDYLLAAQYDNGGWPQFYPLKKGYYTRVTYNDNAMVNVLTLLRDAAAGTKPYAFVDATRRARAATAVEKGVSCILRSQYRRDGALTAWCAQHDERTLAPAAARAFEPPSLAGQESAGIVRFLMAVEKPSPEIVAAVEGAVAWFEKTKITGHAVENFTNRDGQPDRRLVPSEKGQPLWARFYDLNTDRPVYQDRDGKIHDDYALLSRERRVGYAYVGPWPADILAKEYPAWRKRVGL